MEGSLYTTIYHHAEKAPAGESLCLSLYISPSSFMFTVSTNGYRNVTELCHIDLAGTSGIRQEQASTVNVLLHNFSLHQKKFDKVNVSILNTEFTMVPEAFVIGQEIKPILQFATGVEQLKRSQKHRLPHMEFLYGVDTELVTSLERIFPNASIRHAGAVSINLFFNQHSLVNHSLYLHIGEGFLELAAKEKKDLLFYNVFKFTSNEDALYYLLFMMEQFNLNPLYTRLAIAGERPVQDELIKNIRRYVKQVSFCAPDPSVNMLGDLSSLPGHYYFTLLNQHLCEL